MVESSSREAARTHVEEIRRGKGLKDGQVQNQNVGDLERALKIVSDELYRQSTHFLLEIIQNADDNAYDTSNGITPTLDISLYGDYLRVDCNETGFAPKHVEAICKVGSSTKAGVGNATRYVGEKGIGFKSVFKVADVVYINSLAYSFKFEKNGPLGMIAPIWCDFPATAKPGHTTILMHLAHDCNKSDLQREIRLLDSRMLIFLRQLRRINIRIEIAGSATLSRSLSRLPDVPIRSDSASVITLQQDSKIFKYIVSKHMAKSLPFEPKREGVQESQILLAFPVTENLEPKLEQQQVYAFLPVRDYGLQFLLQADFLLIASREDVDDSSEWNRELRSSAVDAVVEVAKWFNAGSMKYTWPRYLPGKGKVSGFFESFKDDLLRRISSQDVLESIDGQFVPPSTLMSYPSKFCDENGRPLTATPKTSCRYLSPKYDPEDYETLTAIGVQEMVGPDFFRELYRVLKDDPAFFCNQTMDWHSYLARALAPLCLDKFLALQIATLKLIPLRDGQWVSIEGKSIFFPGDRHGLTIPDGINLYAIEDEAAQDPFRRHLYRLLGAENFSVDLLCTSIIAGHKDPKFKPASAKNSALLSQALFLFRAGCKIGKNDRFWCVQECGVKRSPASKLYLESDEPLSATKLLGTDKTRFHFLHKSYLDAVPDEKERWRTWLIDTLHVAEYPRLVVSSGKDSFRLSEDFEWLLMHRPSADVLVLLREQWYNYALYLDHDPTTKENHQPNVSRKLLRDRLSFAGVKCRDGTIRQAKNTYLPTNELVAAARGCIHFLDVPHPEDKRWELVFHALQVGLKDDLDFYLQALQTLKVRGPTKDVVEHFLEQIQARSNMNFPKVKKAFSENSLVYIPSSSFDEPAKWVTPSSCVWEGPKFLRTIHVLKDLYPQNHRLFSTILGVEDTNFATLIEESRYMSTSWDLDYVLSLLLEITKMLKDNSSVGMSAEIRDNVFFPIRKVGSLTGVDEYILANDEREWYIADCTHFHRSFAGKIPLLALDVADVGRLKRLIQKAGIDKRRLSIIANGKAETWGGVEYLDAETRSFRSKVNSILRLIPDNEMNRMKVFQQLRAVSVSKAPRVIQSWSVKYQNETIQGEPEDGFVALGSDDRALHLYFAEKTMGSRKSNSELVEKLSSFCGFDKANEDGMDRSYLLLCVIMEDDQEEIDALFDKHKVPPLATDGELKAEEERAKNLETKASLKNIHAGAKHQSITPGSKNPVTAPKMNASYMSMGALAEKILLEQVKVFTVSSDVASQSSTADWVVFARNTKGSSSKKTSPSYALDASVRPGPNGVPSMEDIQVVSLKRSMRSHDLDRLQGLGEVFVHKVLQTKILGADYNPDEHWTSRHRTTSGYSPLPFEGPHSSHASFTISDTSSAFTQFLTKLTKSADSWLSKPPTYHLEVKTTAGGLLDEFNLSHGEFVRARRYRTPDFGFPTDVSVLVRVWNVESGEPQMTLFVDTWAWYVNDKVMMQAVDGFKAHVRYQ